MKAAPILRTVLPLLALLAGSAGLSPRTASAQPIAAPGGTAASPVPGTITGRQGLPPASLAVPRGQRTFARCNREALTRRLRGADRRHFVTRCRLGYGFRLFRRRANAPT